MNTSTEPREQHGSCVISSKIGLVIEEKKIDHRDLQIGLEIDSKIKIETNKTKAETIDKVLKIENKINHILIKIDNKLRAVAVELVKINGDKVKMFINRTEISNLTMNMPLVEVALKDNNK